MILLDTHAWVWWLTEPKKLSKVAQRAISQTQRDSDIGISTMSCWEVAMLVAKNRLAFTIDVEQWIEEALALPTVRFLDLSVKIAVRSSRLPGELHGDPVDRILAATAIEHACPLVTKDERLRSYQHIKAIW